MVGADRSNKKLLWLRSLYRRFFVAWALVEFIKQLLVEIWLNREIGNFLNKYMQATVPRKQHVQNSKE